MTARERESAWLKRMVAIEDGCCISVGGLLMRLMATNCTTMDANTGKREAGDGCHRNRHEEETVAHDQSLTRCDCCTRGFPSVTWYQPQEQAPVALCESCRDELLRDLIEDSSPGFVEILFKRVRYR